jgi:hypothetical protein
MSEPTTVSGRRIPDIDIIEDESFTYDGFQVVRGEFFSHIYEPSFTLNLNKISVNMACIRKLPDVEYVQILVHPEEKNLVIRPCKEEEKDSFRWKTTGKKVSPKQVTCKVFFAKIYALMGWNLDYRYKLLGKLIRSNGELLFVFNLNNPEIYIRVFREGEKPRVSRTPVYPQEWKNQFGISVEEHRKSLSMNKFNEYTIFGVRETAPKGESDISSRKEDVNNESE